jgi:hypothetical protein
VAAIGLVQIFAVPAAGESDLGLDTVVTRTVKVKVGALYVVGELGVGLAKEPDDIGGRLVEGVAGEDAQTLGEGLGIGGIRAGTGEKVVESRVGNEAGICLGLIVEGVHGYHVSARIVRLADASMQERVKRSVPGIQ